MLTGCGTPPASANTRTLRIALYGATHSLDPGILDPARASPATPLFVVSLLHSGLVKLGPDLHVVPELAVSIPTISSSGRTYTFTIRRDARFADGRHCTALDIAYSLARGLQPGKGSDLARRYLGNIVGARAVESGRAKSLAGVKVMHRLTVRIRLTKPDASFLAKLAFPVAAVVERYSSDSLPAGIGPWSLLRTYPDGSLTLQRRSYYYGNGSSIKYVHLVPVPDQARGIELYRKGILDVVQVPARQYSGLQTRPDFHESGSLDAFYALPVNHGRDFAAVLDRDKLLSAVRTISPALGPLNGLVPPAVPDYLASTPNIDATSFPDGKPHVPGVRLEFSPTGDIENTSLGAALLQQWHSGRTEATRVRIVHTSYILPDPGRWLLIVTDQTRSRWLRSTLNHAQELTNDPVTRMSLYSDAENWAINKGLVIPLASGTVAYLIRPTVQSLQVTPLGVMPENNNWSLVSVT
ncbi:MAG: hypothetical protein NVSMB52_20460 [Chloroflexota bacterium]